MTPLKREQPILFTNAITRRAQILWSQGNRFAPFLMNPSFVHINPLIEHNFLTKEKLVLVMVNKTQTLAMNSNNVNSNTHPLKKSRSTKKGLVSSFIPIRQEDC